MLRKPISVTCLLLALASSGCDFIADFEKDEVPSGGKRATTANSGKGGGHAGASTSVGSAGATTSGGAQSTSGGVSAGGVVAGTSPGAGGIGLGGVGGSSGMSSPNGGGGASSGGADTIGGTTSSAAGAMQSAGGTTGGASGASTGGANVGASAGSIHVGGANSAGANTGSTVFLGTPTIASFSVEYNKVCSGNPAKLRASFSNGTGVVSGVGPVMSGETISTQAITSDTSFTLTVKNSLGVTAQSTVAVTVLKSGEFTSTGAPSGMPGEIHMGLGSVPITFPDGRVFVPTSGCKLEEYDVNSGTFNTVGTPQRCFGIAPLADGRVLIAGGILSGGGYTTGALTFDPTTGNSTPTEPLSQTREKHVYVYLPVSKKVLVVGGDWGGEIVIRDTAELYDPTQGANGTFTLLAMQAERVLHTATAMANDRVLVVGGESGNAWEGPCQTSAEVYDPAAPSTSKFAAVGSMTQGRCEHQAVVLADGNVLVTGGHDESYTPVASAEIFNNATGKFTTTGAMLHARSRHSMALLTSGRVLVVGAGETVFSDFEIYNPVTGRFLYTSAPPPKTRGNLTPLPNGAVLLTGSDSANKPSAELYCP